MLCRQRNQTSRRPFDSFNLHGLRNMTILKQLGTPFCAWLPCVFCISNFY